MHLAAMSAIRVIWGRIRAIVRIIALMIALLWYLLRLMLISKIMGETEERGFRYRRKFTRVALWILGVRLTIHGKMADIPVLYVSNHRSLLDPFIQLRHIDAYIVSKSEVEKYPLVGTGARETGVVFVKRESKESRVATREAIKDLLLAGKSVLIYPEGTTSNELLVQDFRVGAFKIAAEINIPVVPVAIQYSDESDHWHDGPMLPFFLRKFAKRRIEAHLSIGEMLQEQDPILLMDKARESITTAIQHARTSMADGSQS
jgi:1-acyl-sn-glycerol-3-phosphate acyltransferase